MCTGDLLQIFHDGPDGLNIPPSCILLNLDVLFYLWACSPKIGLHCQLPINSSLWKDVQRSLLILFGGKERIEKHQISNLQLQKFTQKMEQLPLSEVTMGRKNLVTVLNHLCGSPTHNPHNFWEVQHYRLSPKPVHTGVLQNCAYCFK